MKKSSLELWTMLGAFLAGKRLMYANGIKRKSAAIYKPNGPRERARRMTQIGKMMLNTENRGVVLTKAER